jgi:hypothetical protein
MSIILRTWGNRYPSENIRQVVSANTTFYVDPVAGVDTNPGTVAFPWKTFTGAMANILAMDLRSYPVNLQLADGNYTETAGNIGPLGLLLSGNNSANILTIKGNASNISAVNVTLGSFGIYCATWGMVRLQDFTVTSTFYGITASAAGMALTLSNMRLAGNNLAVGMRVQAGSVVTISNNLTFASTSANTQALLFGTSASRTIISNNTNIVFETANVNFSVSTFNLSGGAALTVGSNVNFTGNNGTVTGKQFNLTQGAFMFAANNNSTDFPGNVAGTVATGAAFFGLDVVSYFNHS